MYNQSQQQYFKQDESEFPKIHQQVTCPAIKGNNVKQVIKLQCHTATVAPTLYVEFSF